MSGVSELVNEVLERAVAEADYAERQRVEAELDMANVRQWITRNQAVRNVVVDTVTLAPAWMNA